MHVVRQVDNPGVIGHRSPVTLVTTDRALDLSGATILIHPPQDTRRTRRDALPAFGGDRRNRGPRQELAFETLSFPGPTYYYVRPCSATGGNL